LNKIHQPGDQANAEQANQRQFDKFVFGIVHLVLLGSCSAVLDEKLGNKLHFNFSLTGG
jgi:hypothetical protein